MTLWMGAGMALLNLFGVPAPWYLLPFRFVRGHGVWAAMGRMLGFMLFPREGAAGGACRSCCRRVSAVADLPLACSSFDRRWRASLLRAADCVRRPDGPVRDHLDRERLMDGLGRTRRRRAWFRSRRSPQCCSHRAGLLIAGVSAALANTINSGEHWHSWTDVQAPVTGSAPDPVRAATNPAPSNTANANGITIASQVSPASSRRSR